MDIRNNRLVDHEMMAAMLEDERKNYTPVPEELNRAARRALNGKREVTVSMNSGGKLSEWARKERNKAKAARKQAKKSRRKNR